MCKKKKNSPLLSSRVVETTRDRERLILCIGFYI
nr:MAG TPA: hypothetical protein [Caudoviricetes sp.]DAK94870.1 MAG TPA: hypothetical protein [Caudoviricetes sp.]